MKLRQQNAFAIITVLVLLTILFITFFVMLKPFAMVYDKMNDNARYAVFTDSSECVNNTGNWVNGACQALPERASLLVQRVKSYWLLAPIIFAIGLIIWLIVVSTRRDPQYFQLR